ncbi:MAG: hypothetical protein JWO30_2625 [Fibrobacteres bacterium]|nr:hypothetical protein [Fibrobacterota bacterium]
MGMGVLFYTSSLPGDRIHLPPFPYSDKAVHFAAYAALGFLISLRKPLRRRLIAKGIPLTGRSGSGDAPGGGLDFAGLATGMLYGVSDEIHQIFVPMRMYDYGDMAADALGVVLGCWIFARIFRPAPEAAASGTAA